MTKATPQLRDVGTFFATVFIAILIVILTPFLIILNNFYDRQIKV